PSTAQLAIKICSFDPTSRSGERIMRRSRVLIAVTWLLLLLRSGAAAQSSAKIRAGGLGPQSGKTDTAGSKILAVLLPPTVEPSPEPPHPHDAALPINLATALQLADARAIDVALAAERVQAAAAQLQRARALWLPTVLLGTDYFRHDGQIQDVL